MPNRFVITPLCLLKYKAFRSPRLLQHPDWLVELHTKGWTVVRGALPRDRALAYADKGYEWLESWNLGFDRKDPSTRKTANLPWHTRVGLYNGFVMNTGIMDSVVVSGNTNTAGSIGTASVTSSSYGI